MNAMRNASITCAAVIPDLSASVSRAVWRKKASTPELPQRIRGHVMPISRDTARDIMSTIDACCTGLFSVLPKLEAELSQEEFARIKREFGRVIGVMDSSISAKIAAEYPDLAPTAVPTAHKLWIAG
jgi:hypothetical protein